jgi:hypothetical protein
MSASPNRYCNRLRIPVPTVESVVGQPEARVFHLMVVALLECGAPMTLDDIAARLQRVALPARLVPKGDLRASLNKAWRGRPPIVRDTDDRVALDLLFDEWWYIAFQLELRRPRWSPPAVPDVTNRPDGVPLSAEEVAAAFKDRGLHACSSIRQAAAILEVVGAPLALEELNRRLGELSACCFPIHEDSLAAWRSDLVTVEPDGALRMNPHSAEAPAFRRAIRRMGLAQLRVAARHAAVEAERPDFERARDAERRVEIEEARAMTRALIHVAPGANTPLAVALVDAQARRVQVLAGDELAGLASMLDAFDLLAGVDLRPTLRALGLDPEQWLLAELRPTDRTHRPGDGAPVAVTLDACLRATTGVRHALATPTEWQRLFEEERPARLVARIEAEARALFTLYEYGALQSGVRVRAARPDDRLLPVSWAPRGAPDIHAIVQAAEQAWSAVDVVVGPPSELADPWRDARRVVIVDRNWPRLLVRADERVGPLDVHDAFAIRCVDPAAPTRRRGGLDLRFDRRLCQLKVTLLGIEPPIWRRLVVPASLTLDRVHEVLQAALGWTNSHLHVFEIGGERIGIPYELGDLEECYTRTGRIVHLGDVVGRGQRQFIYEYDFGDGWRHAVEIEDIRMPTSHEWTRCLDGARACPPEDCGGADGYQRLLEILFDPTHPEFHELRAWAGPDFQPERFSVRQVNEALREARSA